MRYRINQTLLPRLEMLRDVVELLPVAFQFPILFLELLDRRLPKQTSKLSVHLHKLVINYKLTPEDVIFSYSALAW
jgi:hypothetical protein